LIGHDLAAADETKSSMTALRGRLERLSMKFGVQPWTFLLGIGFFLGCVAPTEISRLMGQYPTNLAIFFNAIFVTSSTLGHDSWLPIQNALRYLAENKPEGLYEATYWQSPDQFIYPPPSILFVRLTNWPSLLDWMSTESLNQFFRWVFFANAAVLVIVFNDFYRVLGAGTASVQPAERLARVLIPLGAVLLFYPLLGGFWVGNIQTGLTFLLLLSLLLWLRGHRGLVGVCLGLVCIFKPNLAPIVLWALLRREYRVVTGFLCTIIPLGVVSIAIYGIGVHLEYLKLMSYLSSRGESYVDSHSINSMLNRAVFNGPNLEWDGSHSQIRYIGWIHYATVLSSLCFIAVALVGKRKTSAAGSWLDYAVALLAISLASPVVYGPHLGFTIALIMMAGLMLLRARPAPFWAVFGLALSYFLMANELKFTDALAETPFNFLQSYRLFGAIILLAILYRLRNSEDHRSYL
jgi:alpha-1,2-mannosyltransferase